jgi:CRP/FNR family transcriptional regulator, cyclic AMP receptor protein
VAVADPAHAGPAHARDFWGMLTRQEQSTLRARSTLSYYGNGAVILAEGIAVDKVTIVRSGWAKATVIKADRPVLLRLYGPGELIGVAAALTGGDPTETITSSSREVHVMTLPAFSFADFLHRAPNAAAALHRVQQWRLEEADRIRTIRDYPTAAQRIAGLLSELCRPENNPFQRNDGTIAVPASETALSQQDLGSWIGDSRKTVVRALAELRRRGLVRSPLRECIDIPSPDRLRSFAEAADAGRPTN